MPFDGTDRHHRENALAILEDVQAYLATPGKWTRGAWSINGRQHCVMGAVKLMGRRRKVPLKDNRAGGYVCRALRRERSPVTRPEVFNDCGPGLPLILELVASAIEIARAELDGLPVPTEPRCPILGVWYDGWQQQNSGESVPYPPLG